eukprot:6033260-Pleurochrysis_carterae.AAC.1
MTAFETIAGVCAGVSGIVITYIVKTRIRHIRVCCGFIECWRKIRSSFHSRGAESNDSLDSRSIP